MCNRQELLSCLPSPQLSRHCCIWLRLCPVSFPLVPRSLCPTAPSPALPDWKIHHRVREKRRKEWEAGPQDCSLQSEEAPPQKLQDIAPRFVYLCLYLVFSLLYLCLYSQQPCHRGIIFSLLPDRICQHRNVLAEEVPEKLSTNIRGLIRQLE